jgi:hypothetical protein
LSCVAAPILVTFVTMKSDFMWNGTNYHRITVIVNALPFPYQQYNYLTY